MYNNSIVKQYFISKWDFVDEELVEVPANNKGTQYRVSKTHSCRRFEGYGYPARTLYCKSHTMYNDVNDLAKGDSLRRNLGELFWGNFLGKHFLGDPTMLVLLDPREFLF